jgi:hypothetical protein
MLYYIICDKKIILSKKSYQSWQDIQAEYSDYKTSLGPWTKEELLDYFRNDYKEEEFPFSEQEIDSLTDSIKDIIEKAV